jgi:hypothetical protein
VTYKILISILNHIVLAACIAARIVVESPHHALRMGGLETNSLCAAQKKEHTNHLGIPNKIY